MIEVDELVTGLQNRAVMAIQSVVRSRDRESIRDTESMIERIRTELAVVEEQWGVRVLQFGFSNLMDAHCEPWGVEIETVDFTTITPSAETLRITQLTPRTKGRTDAMAAVLDDGIRPGSALSMLGSSRFPRRRMALALQREWTARQQCSIRRKLLQDVEMGHHEPKLRAQLRALAHRIARRPAGWAVQTKKRIPSETETM